MKWIDTIQQRLRSLLKAAILALYERRITTSTQTQSLIDRFRLWDA